MKKVLIALVLLVTYSFTGYSKIWTISNSGLTVQFDDQALKISVKDNRCNRTWEQVPFKETYSLKKIKQNGNSLEIAFKAPMKMTVNLSLTPGSDLVFTLTSDPEGAMTELSFPPAFKSPDSNDYLLMTDSEGYLVQADDPDFGAGRNNLYTMAGGLTMSWLGFTDHDFKTGYMVILDTPDDAAFDVVRQDNLLTFEPVWLSTLGTFGYDRKAIYHFFDEGGYVAQCKKYRDYIWKRNQVVTLRENQKKFPAIGKMIGAVHIYVWDEARKVSFAKEMKKSGIDKAFILWDPNHTPYPEPDYDSRLKELGYASGVYELFRDIHPSDSIVRPPSDKPDQAFLSRPHYPGMYPAITLKKKDGSIDQSSFGSHVCPAAVYPLIPGLRVDKELSIYPHESYFIDVYLSNMLYECYDKDHPLTRTQYREAVTKIYKLFTDKYKMFCGGEWGADYVGSESVYSHGLMTLHRTWFGSDAYKRGTIYYIGSWSNERPSIMISTSTATDDYLKYSINEYIRVPLYELVYHDANVTTWRWEDGNDKLPEIWWKKDLFNILYGTAPLWSIDQELWRKYKRTFVESYRNICPWLEKIGYDEMVSHRFVTPDRKVQESVFSSGKKVIVNFGDNDFVYEGNAIKGKSFITL